MKAISLFRRRRLLRIMALAAIAGAFGVGAMPARAATPAESFVEENVQHGLAILNDKSLTADQTEQRFLTFLDSLTDVRRIALFTLGSAASAASPTDVDVFVGAFRDYADAVDQSQLAEYSGETLKVTGSVERASGDFIVNTVIAEPSGRTTGSEVDFRVSNTGSRMVVTDVSVRGVWLALQERDQFTGFLSQHNNDVKALADDLKRRAASIRTGGR
jgi:phospholipid transport system substrate-binding protein